jgi:hypothetical protein
MIPKVVSSLEQNMYKLYYMTLYEPLFDNVLYLRWYTIEDARNCSVNLKNNLFLIFETRESNIDWREYFVTNYIKFYHGNKYIFLLQRGLKPKL